MDLFGLKESIQSEDRIIDLKIENFSVENTASQKKTIIPKLFNGLYAFNVSVFPNGSCPKYANYVSLIVKSSMIADFTSLIGKSSMTANRDLTAMASYNSMTCTASVVDVRGEGRYSQSFGIETILFIDCYVPGLERFIKRSTLLSQKEELLPDDVLTMRFEFSFRSNQEIDMLSKVTEFLPSILVDPSNLGASGTHKNGICDFFNIFEDIEEKSNEECSGFACAKSVDTYVSDNKLKSVKASIGIHEIIAARQTFDFESRKDNEYVQTVLPEIHVEKEHQILDDVIHKENVSNETSGIGIQKSKTHQAAGSEMLNKSEAYSISGNGTHKEKEDQTSKYETKELIKIHEDEISNESNKSTGKHVNEMKFIELSNSVEEKIRQLQQIGGDTAKNIIIVVNGHRMFRKSNQSRRNRVDFSLTTDEELYKIFYYTVSLEDEECKSIYRMHGALPFFHNLMDRDENALFHDAKNKTVGFPENDDGQRSTLVSSGATCSTNEIVDDGEPENFQHSRDKNVSLSSGKLRVDSTEKHMKIENFGKGYESTTTSEKNDDETEKGVRNDESSNEEDDIKEYKGNFLIQTVDNAFISVRFEAQKETIGSKLVAASVVFGNMLRHPLKERSERRVELKDVTSRTVNNLLSYVDNGQLSDLPLPDAYDLYEAADKYAVKNLMKACADFMAYFPIRENVWSMVKLAELHSDDYLLELAELVQKLIFRLEQASLKTKNEFMDMIKGLVKDLDASLEATTTQSDFFAQDFNFYQ